MALKQIINIVPWGLAEAVKKCVGCLTDWILW